MPNGDLGLYDLGTRYRNMDSEHPDRGVRENEADHAAQPCRQLVDTTIGLGTRRGSRNMERSQANEHP